MAVDVALLRPLLAEVGVAILDRGLVGEPIERPA
jgi:hypothetical protein